jgi:hypothetical protein
VKLGGGATQHHNLSMLEHCLSVGITSCLISGAHLLIPYLEHDLPLYTFENVIGCFVL